MTKSSREKPTKVEIQKGPVNMEAQYTQKFQSAVRRFEQDMANAELRMSGQTLTLHEPKK